MTHLSEVLWLLALALAARLARLQRLMNPHTESQPTQNTSLDLYAWRIRLKVAEYRAV